MCGVVRIIIQPLFRRLDTPPPERTNSTEVKRWRWGGEAGASWEKYTCGESENVRTWRNRDHTKHVNKQRVNTSVSLSKIDYSAHTCFTYSTLHTHWRLCVHIIHATVKLQKASHIFCLFTHGGSKLQTSKQARKCVLEAGGTAHNI